MRHTSQKSHKIHKSGPMTQTHKSGPMTHSPMTRSSPPYRGYHPNPTRIPYRIISDPYQISITTPHPLHPDLDPIGSSDRSMTHLLHSLLIRSTHDSSPYYTTLDHCKVESY